MRSGAIASIRTAAIRSCTSSGRPAKANRYWFVEESGTYRQTADTLEVKPSEVRRVLRDRDGRARSQPQPLPTEPVTYRYAIQYLFEHARWRLVDATAWARSLPRGERDDISDYGLGPPALLRATS